MTAEERLRWLLAGDVAIQYQVYRDLLGEERPFLQSRIATEGWGNRLLQHRRADGHWGKGFYQPKWTSTHYTLLDLKNLGLPPTHPQAVASVSLVLRDHKSEDGGVNPAKTIKHSDVCINGMVLNYACYFGAEETALHSVVDFLITQHMPDGGFNCQLNRQGAVHSSLHSTISVLEGLWAYRQHGYQYRLSALEEIAAAAREFILMHQLFRSDRTGNIINKGMLMLSYPSRWYYDILRALDYFQAAGIAYDERMQPALDIVGQKQRQDGTWPVQARHAGETYFDMERTGGPSRWNTLRVLRVWRHFGLGKENGR